MRQLGSASLALRDTVDALWPEADVRLADLAALPRVTDGDEAYVVVPSLSRALQLSPLRSGRRSASVTILRYNLLRSPRTLLNRVAAAAALQTPAANRLPCLIIRDSAGESFLRHVAEQIGDDQLMLGVGVRRLDGHHKPVVSVFDRRAHAVCFVKVGVSRRLAQRLSVEYDILRLVQRAGLDGVKTPKPLFLTGWRGHTILGTAPLPIGLRRATRWHYHAARRSLDRLVASLPQADVPLVESSWWHSNVERSGRLAATAVGPALAEHREALESRWGRHLLRFGVRHGDWSPWNIGQLKGQIHAWDWEYAEALGPSALDALQWHWQCDTILRRRSEADAANRLRAKAARVLRERSIDPAMAVDVFLWDQAMRMAENSYPPNAADHSPHVSASVVKLLELATRAR